MEFEIFNLDGSTVTLIKAIHLESNDPSFTTFDSITHNKDNIFGNGGFTEWKSNSCYSLAYGFEKYHKLVLYTSTDTIYTPVFQTPNWSNCSFKIFKDGNNISVKENYILYAKRIIIGIMITLTITHIIKLIVFKISIRGRFSNCFKYILTLNSISTIGLWITYGIFKFLKPWNLISLLFTEIIFVTIETHLYNKYFDQTISKKRINTTTIIANILSFLIGIIISILYFEIVGRIDIRP
jgi:hypothetical protein